MIGDYTWARGPKGDSRSRSAEPPFGSFLTIRRNEMRSTRRCGAEFPRLLQAAEEDDRRRECGPLLVAELVARGLDSFVRDSIDIPHIVRRVQLPAFQYDIHAPYAWPRSSSVDAGSLVFRAISELGSRSA